MQRTSPLRILLVGAGDAGSRYARVLSRSDDCELVRIVDPDEPAGRALAERHDSRWYPELQGQLDRRIDGVVLAAPTRHHHGLALQILAAGKPLLIEQPVCDGLVATHEVLDAAAEKDVPLMCGMRERYNPAILTGFALLENPVHITAVCHGPYTARTRTGVAWDQLLHDVDLVVRAFDGKAPIRTKGFIGHSDPVPAGEAADDEAEDVAEALLTFAGGGLGTASASRRGQRKVHSIVVAELDRLIELDLLLRDVTIYRHVPDDALHSAAGRGHRRRTIIEIPELVTAKDPLDAQLEHFIALIRGRADAADERASILPAHQIVDRVLSRSADGAMARDDSPAADPEPSGARNRASAVADFTGALR